MLANVINNYTLQIQLKMNSGASQFYFSSYFVSNVLLLFSYPALRYLTSAGKKNLKNQDYFGFSYQNSIIYTVLILAIMGYIRATSLRGFIVEFFSVGKVGVTALLVFAKIRFALIYGVICLILWMIVPYPKYLAPNKFIRIKSVQQFDQIINHHNKSSQLKKVSKKQKFEEEQSPFQYQDKWMLFIQFYADWALPCTLGKQLWYNYSMKYTTERLIFLQINVDRLPELAKRYKINTSGFSKQLPSIVIVSNGEQESRFPPIDQNNKVSKVIKLDYKVLLKFFDLESRYLQTRQFVSSTQNSKPKHE